MSETVKRILFQLTVLFFAVILIEFWLRKLGHKPGDMTPKWAFFTPVDSLITQPDFYTDTNGILVAGKEYWAQNYNVYINAEGYQTKEFSRIDTTKKKVLFIGDSFTWGFSASPFKDSSFVNLLAQDSSIEVINLGITGADPAQYAAIAKRYIPILKPNLIVVPLYLGNDIMMTDRKVAQNEPYMFSTNAGMIMAYDGKKHFYTAQTAYHYFVNEKYYFNKPTNIVEYAISKSALLAQLYSVRFRIVEKLNQEKGIHNSSITLKYLTQIKNLAIKNNATVKFVVIPEIKEAEKSAAALAKRYASLLADTALKNDWLYLNNVMANYQPVTDGHLNNTGHKFYAEYLKEVIEAELNK